MLHAVLDLLAGRYPSRGVRRAAAPHRVGPRRRHRAGPRRRPAAGRHQRRHHPRPRPVRRVPARRHPGRRARRGDGLRVPAGRDVPARRVDVAHRGHHPRPRRSSRRRRASPGRCRSGTATARPPARAGPGGRRVRPRAAPAPPRRGRWRACASDARPRRAGRAATSLQYLDEQAEATGAVPDDRTIVVERFRDEIGDWRVCMLSPFGAQVHAPWAHGARRPGSASGWGLDVELALERRRHRAAPARGDRRAAARRARSSTPTRSTSSSCRPLPDTALFASRFRECAARALLLPAPPARPAHAAVAAAPAGGRPARGGGAATRRSRSCSRRPASASTTCSTCPRCARCCATSAAARSASSPVDTPQASPFAQSLLFGWIAVYMYEGDAPLAERRAAALALDRDLLRELLGAEELRELLDPDVLADLELELQRLVDGRRARDADEVHDLLRRLGPLTLAELDAAQRRLDVAAAVGRRSSSRERRAIRCASPARRASPPPRTPPACATRSASPLPVGPARRAFTEPVDRPLDDLVARFARTHGPFLTEQVAPAARRSPLERVLPVLERARGRGPGRAGRVPARAASSGSGATTTCCASCGAGRSPRCARRSSRSTRDGAGPLPARRGTASGERRRGLDALVEVLGQLQGAALPGVGAREPTCSRPASTSYRPADLDALCTAGEVVWVGAGAHRRGRRPGAPRLPRPGRRCSRRRRGDELDAAARCTRRCSTSSRPAGRRFWPELVQAVADAGQPYDDAEVLAALWDLVWAGEVTNDSLAPLRALVVGHGASAAPAERPRRRPAAARRRLTRLGPPAGAGRWSLVAPLLEPAPTPTEAAHARAAPAARAPRRAHPRGGAGRGRRGRLRRRVPAC